MEGDALTKTRTHCDANALAALAEHGHKQADPGVLAHLAVCPACMGAYADAVRAIDARLAGAGTSAAEQPAPVLRLLPRRRRRAAPVFGGLAAAAVLLLMLLPLVRDGGDLPDPRAGVQERLVRLSTSGPLYPGVERTVTDGEPRYRDGGETDLAGLIDPLRADFEAHPADADRAYWLSAGYLAAGRLATADDVLRRALQHHPDDVALRQLAAIAAYRLNELDRAESEFEAVLARRPRDAAARFNLALIRVETGRAEAARAVLDTLAADAANPAVQARARALLERLGG